MQFAPLASVKHRIKLGAPLPFNIRNNDHTLLLARGKVISSEEQMDALFERGALVDSEEVQSFRSELHHARPEDLPGLWSQSMERVGKTLRAHVQKDFCDALDAAAKPVLALIEHDPDLAIFQVVRQQAAGKTHYGVQHAIHSAIATYLAAQRLEWPQARVLTAFKAALTMNISIIEMQARLAMQVSPLTSNQRKAIDEHPQRSVEMLREAGIADEEWLTAVGQHHECEDGSGYPSKICKLNDLAALVARTDVFTAKLSPRVNRNPLPAHQAARDLFMRDQGHPMTAAIIKEFGVYPPGCFVKLGCGEVGIVIKRGAGANTPIVAALTNRDGDAMMEPVRRNCATAGHGIVSVVDERTLRVRVSPEKLASMAAH
nr:HD domain-containing phosphohydrolase [uncultured Roseateles sp.]